MCDGVRRWARQAAADARCEPADDLDEAAYFATTPQAPGAWSTGDTPADALSELESVLVGWATVRLDLGLAVPGLEQDADGGRSEHERATGAHIPGEVHPAVP